MRSHDLSAGATLLPPRRNGTDPPKRSPGSRPARNIETPSGRCNARCGEHTELVSSVMLTSVAFEQALRTSIPPRTRRTVAGAGLVDAGVLVPVLLHAGEPHLLFTRRTDRVETHKGQISFPGGVVDAGDADVVATALRETHEELGIAPDDIETLGLLDDLATPTGFRITPVVGLIRHRHVYVPSAEEVEEVFEARVSALLDPAVCSSEILVLNGITRRVWTYAYGPYRIWGATAYILRNLLALATPAPDGQP